jgi:negative regulator of flagellin synthesis FlgM
MESLCGKKSVEPLEQEQNTMSNINPLGNNNPVNRVGPTKPTPRTPIDQPVVSPKADRVELSGTDALLAKLKTNQVRTDKVAEIKAQIDAGTYETPDKIDAAIDRLMNDLD